MPGQASVHELTSEAPSGRATPVPSSSRKRQKDAKRVEDGIYMEYIWNIYGISMNMMETWFERQ